ncbi:Crp/Fnr family transcriptional regulator [Dyadobacter subterraneus]|uniref:Crp/Fnr family transcriptional regulator n=1 Tax=Dyadobacter subterraneus TaxID=2773304 RepID=A0ABR9W745_9BACT|nr:Crp/Fnr family transcriptional regulator [Dyadobacter subterraneus]MBE9461292.1 Crp/Fnr family transcriptional regulator [Dyadobacter subterraneus]
MNTDLYISIRENIQKKVHLTTDEMNELLDNYFIKRIKRKQLIIQPDFIAKHRSYVISGALRAFVIDNNGQSHTIQFAIEDWWISDYNSYVNQQPATMFVEALEDSTILQIDYESEQMLMASNHKYETLFRKMAERTAAFTQRRLISSFTQSAEQRYEAFLENYPLAVQRLPQYVLASYLGMSTEFLSKIRHNKLKNKS